MDKLKKIEWPLSYDELSVWLGVKPGTVKYHKNYLSKKGEFRRNKHFIEEPNTIGHSYVKIELEGALAIARRLSTPQAAELLHKNDTSKLFVVKKEHDYLSIISESISGFLTSERNFKVGRFKVDLYIPELFIAIECDEFNHSKGYDEKNEIMREKYIREELGCEIFRFNPDDFSHNIGKTINYIFNKYILSKRPL